jgi:hypothetical protein
VYDSRVISRRRLHLVLTLLLPLLTLRALLPAGFMVSAAADGPRIVMCSEGLAAWSAAAEDSRHPQPAASGGDCLFALSAASAPPPQYVASGTVPVLNILFLPTVSGEPPHSTGPPRESGARAPPLSRKS